MVITHLRMYILLAATARRLALTLEMTINRSNALPKFKLCCELGGIRRGRRSLKFVRTIWIVDGLAFRLASLLLC